MRKLLLSLCAVLALSISAVPAAHADILTYTFSGDPFFGNGSFQIDSSIPPLYSGDFDSVPAFGGTGDYFYSSSAEFLNPNQVYGWDFLDPASQNLFAGQQLYSGSEASPTFLTGTFNLVNVNDGNPITLTVVDNGPSASATPEPSSLLLLGTGLLGTLGAIRRRFKA